MGTELKKASLEMLCTQGPWEGHTVSDSFTLTADELRAYFEAIQRGVEHPARVLRAAGGSRKTDKANQILRKAGLIVFSGKGKDRRWRATLEAGVFVQ